MPRSPARERFLADIIIGATEGGTNYWAYSGRYHWSDENPAETNVYLADMEELDEAEHALGSVPPTTVVDDDQVERVNDPWHHCTTDTVAEAFEILAASRIVTDRLRGANNKDLYLHPSLATRYLGASVLNDAGDLDAGDCDNLVQIGMFGKVVYG